MKLRRYWLAILFVGIFNYSCEKDCDTISVSFENRYSDRTLTLLIDDLERATLGPGDKVTLDLETGFHTREFEGGCARGTMELECRDDGLEYFCPG